MTTNHDQAPSEQAARDAALKIADAGVRTQTYALEQAGEKYADMTLVAATRAMTVDLLRDEENDRSSLACATAMLAVQCARGEIGQPYGMLAAPARMLVLALLALEDAHCDTDNCPGPTLDPYAGDPCRRCEALAMLRDWTGLTGDEDSDQVDRYVHEVDRFVRELADRAAAGGMPGQGPRFPHPGARQ